MGLSAQLLLGPVPLLKWRAWAAQSGLLSAKRQAFVEVPAPAGISCHYDAH